MLLWYTENSIFVLLVKKGLPADVALNNYNQN